MRVILINMLDYYLKQQEFAIHQKFAYIFY